MTNLPATVTLDTNLLQEYWKNQTKRSAVERLIELARTGRLALAVTARIREDVPSPPMSALIDELGSIGVDEIGSVTNPDHWVLGRDTLGSDPFVAVSTSIEKAQKASGRKPPDWRDWDHLHAHFLARRDVFLTWDKAVLDAGSELKTQLGVLIMRPEEFLSTL